jgi:hypothetical protein
MITPYKFLLDANGFYNVNAPDYTAQADGAESDSFLERNLPVSRIGTPVFCWLEIEAGQYTDSDGNTVQYDGFTRADGTQINVVLFNVSQTKNIVETTIQGRNGTVKEYVSDGDYQVSIYGVFVAKTTNSYPEKEMQKLVAITKSNRAIKVNSWYLRQFGIYNLVIKEPNFAQNAAQFNSQPWQLTCVSDQPVELLREEDTVKNGTSGEISIAETKTLGAINSVADADTKDTGVQIIAANN